MDGGSGHVYIWGWGLLDESSGAKCCSSPSLLDTMRAGSVRRLQTSPGHTVALTQVGGLFRWVGIASKSGDDAKRMAFRPVDAAKAERGPMRYVDVTCTRDQILALDDAGRIHQTKSISDQWNEDGKAPPPPKLTPISASFIDTKVRFSRVTSTSSYVLALTAEGRVYSWGNGAQGALGHGSERNQYAPRPVEALSHTVASRVATGWRHSGIVSDRGEIWMWGWGGRGQLGNGNCQDLLVPARVDLPRGTMAIDLALGYEHTAAVGAGGNVMTWGGGGRGQLGTGQKRKMETRPQILDNSTGDLAGQHAIGVSCGSFHTAVVTALGEVLVWGWGRHGQLGLGDLESSTVPRLVRAISGMDASIVCCGGQSTLVATDNFMVVKHDYFGVDSPSRQKPSNSGVVPVIFSESKSKATTGLTRTSADSPPPLPADTTPPPPPRDTNANARRDSSAASPAKSNIFRSILSVFSPVQGSVDGGAPVGATGAAIAKKSTPKKRATPPKPLIKSRRGAANQVFPTTTFRPANLPPKSPADLRRHLREVEKMNALYRKKLEREAKTTAMRRKRELQRKSIITKQIEKARREKLERENKLLDMVSVWQKEILPHWNNKQGFLIKRQTTVRARARDLAMKAGVPSRVRGMVWPLWCQDELSITPDEFKRCGAKAASARARKEARARGEGVEGTAAGDASGGIDGEREVQTEGKEMSYELIATDVARTFPSYAFFQKECPMHDELQILLESFCFFRPMVGYVQGMSYLAGHLMFYLNVYNSFVLFSNLLSKPMLQAFLRLDKMDPRMALRFELHEQSFEENLPALKRHFLEEDVLPDMYFLEWVMTLYCKRLALDVVGRVWDQYFVQGEVIIYRAAVAILTILRPELMGKPLSKLLKALATLPNKIKAEELVAAMRKVKFSAAFRRKLERTQALGSPGQTDATSSATQR